MKSHWRKLDDTPNETRSPVFVEALKREDFAFFSSHYRVVTRVIHAPQVEAIVSLGFYNNILTSKLLSYNLVYSRQVLYILTHSLIRMSHIICLSLPHFYVYGTKKKEGQSREDNP